MGIRKRAWDSYKRYSENIFDAIGGTPLVRLNKVAADVEPEVYAKLEWYSPSGSLKDRIYYNMILKAEERGDLTAGMTVPRMLHRQRRHRLFVRIRGEGLPLHRRHARGHE